MAGKSSHYLGATILLIWGSMMIYFYATGRIEIYLAPEFRIVSLIAGLGLVVLGLFNFLTAKAEVDCGHDHGDGDDGHEHDHGPAVNPVSVVFLLVPLLVAARFSEDSFSARAVANKGAYNQNYEAKPMKEQFDLRSEGAETAAKAAVDAGAPDLAVMEEPPLPEPLPGVEPAPVPPSPGEPAAVEETAEDSYGEYTLADLEAQVDKSADGNYLLTIPQLFYTGGDEELQRVITGLSVETVGQVMPEEINNEGGTRLRVFRLFIECCAADARPLSIPAEFGKAPPEHEEMGWVKIIGSMSYVSEDGMTVPVLEVKSMEPTEPPEDEMIF